MNMAYYTRCLHSLGDMDHSDMDHQDGQDEVYGHGLFKSNFAFER